MSSSRTYIWQAGDQRWFVAARFLAESGYDTVSELAERIMLANPTVFSWSASDVPAGTVVTIPSVDA